MTREDKVNEFRKAAGKLNYDKAPEDIDMILDCLDEEIGEFWEAAYKYAQDGTVEARKQLVKEWADAQYVLSQAALYFDIPADAALNRVHNNNMTKVVDGEVRYREDGKVLKPDNYQPADMDGL